MTYESTNRRRKIKHFGLGLMLLAMVMQPAFVSADVSAAVTYLQGQTQDAWITMALVAAGQTGVPTSHLTSVSGTLATDYAKMILAVVAAGENPNTFGSVDYVAQLKTFHNNNQMGDDTLLNDDAWSILALASVNEVGSIQVTDAKNFLLANQNTDGGWGYSVGGDSDTNDTAAIVIALVEAGVSTSDPVITDAVTYLQSAQNSDGGFPYQSGSDSDSGSDAWVISAIYKLGLNPVDWDQQSNNPITHLESLQDTDGGFWWVDPATQPSFNNKAMTAYAVIALSGSSYPVAYFQSGPPPGTYHLRIEGQNNTICQADVAAGNALAIVESGAQVCSYTYNITQETFGPYLREINNEEAAGSSGWMYFINNISPPVGAADYVLQEGDDVLWYYGDWGWDPTRIILDKTEADPGEVISVNAQYFNDTDWLPVPNAIIKINDEDRTADAVGHLNLSIVDNGIYYLYVDTPGFVRSQKAMIIIGDTVSQNISLQVEVDQSTSGGPGGGIVGGQAIALVVTPNQLSFGTLKPGQSANQELTLSNEGTVNLDLGATVDGDPVFIAGIKINDQGWQSYTDSLIAYQLKTANVSLIVPTAYLASGVKAGELIIWATAQ